MIDDRTVHSNKLRWSGSVLDQDRISPYSYGEVLGVVRMKAQHALRDFPGYTVVELGIRRSEAGGWTWNFRLGPAYQ